MAAFFGGSRSGAADLEQSAFGHRGGGQLGKAFGQ
jgi:hypothetical protein